MKYWYMFWSSLYLMKNYYFVFQILVLLSSARELNVAVSSAADAIPYINLGIHIPAAGLCPLSGACTLDLPPLCSFKKRRWIVIDRTLPVCMGRYVILCKFHFSFNRRRRSSSHPRQERLLPLVHLLLPSNHSFRRRIPPTHPKIPV